MGLKSIIAALLMVSLLAGCALPINTDLHFLAAPQNTITTPEEDLLTQEDAKQIALHHAKAPESDTQGLRLSFEYDDGIPEYDISFYFMNYEYEYEIHAVSGRIISYEREK